MLNLHHVRSLMAVIEHGNFREAARRLRCSQPAVSQHVRKLEEALQATLILRDRQSCRPTPEAEAFIPYARSLLSLAERAEAAQSAEDARDAARQAEAAAREPMQTAERDMALPAFAASLVPTPCYCGSIRRVHATRCDSSLPHACWRSV